MITIQEMSDMLRNHGEYIHATPDDVSMFCTSIDQLIDRLPEKYRHDLCGFEQQQSRYEPKFATMQDEWDKEYNEFCNEKAEWCRKYGCE